MKTFVPKAKTKKVNFIIRIDLLEDLEKVIPSGKRSEFINQVLEEAITDFSRKQAYEKMKNIQIRDRLSMNSGEILKVVHEGRKQF